MEQARRMFFDTLVFDAPTLKHLLHVFGPDALVPGTDHPFPFHEPRPLARRDEAVLEPHVEEALAYANARRVPGQRSALPGKTLA